MRKLLLISTASLALFTIGAACSALADDAPIYDIECRPYPWGRIFESDLNNPNTQYALYTVEYKMVNGVRELVGEPQLYQGVKIDCPKEEAFTNAGLFGVGPKAVQPTKAVIADPPPGQPPADQPQVTPPATTNSTWPPNWDHVYVDGSGGRIVFLKDGSMIFLDRDGKEIGRGTFEDDGPTIFDHVSKTSDKGTGSDKSTGTDKSKTDSTLQQPSKQAQDGPETSKDRVIDKTSHDANDHSTSRSTGTADRSTREMAHHGQGLSERVAHRAETTGHEIGRSGGPSHMETVGMGHSGGLGGMHGFGGFGGMHGLGGLGGFGRLGIGHIGRF